MHLCRLLLRNNNFDVKAVTAIEKYIKNWFLSENHKCWRYIKIKWSDILILLHVINSFTFRYKYIGGI